MWIGREDEVVVLMGESVAPKIRGLSYTIAVDATMDTEEPTGSSGRAT